MSGIVQYVLTNIHLGAAYLAECERRGRLGVCLAEKCGKL